MRNVEIIKRVSCHGCHQKHPKKSIMLAISSSIDAKSSPAFSKQTSNLLNCRGNFEASCWHWTTKLIVFRQQTSPRHCFTPIFRSLYATSLLACSNLISAFFICCFHRRIPRQTVWKAHRVEGESSIRANAGHLYLRDKHDSRERSKALRVPDLPKAPEDRFEIRGIDWLWDGFVAKALDLARSRLTLRHQINTLGWADFFRISRNLFKQSTSFERVVGFGAQIIHKSLSNKAFPALRCQSVTASTGLRGLVKNRSFHAWGRHRFVGNPETRYIFCFISSPRQHPKYYYRQWMFSGFCWNSLENIIFNLWKI